VSALSAVVLAQIARLGGKPKARAGSALEAFQRVSWPKGSSFSCVEGHAIWAWGVEFGLSGPVENIDLRENPAIPGPFEIIAMGDGGNYTLFVPRAHADDPDPPIFHVDSEAPDQTLFCTNSLSGFLSSLDPKRHSRELGPYLLRHPREPQACFLRGLENVHSQYWKGALIEFDRALAQRPAYLDAQVHRARVRREMGDWRGALADYDAVLARSIYDADTFLQRGFLYEERRMKKRAALDLQRAAELDPSNKKFTR
jgi:tetratricopeptide (TPR) repeat protein